MVDLASVGFVDRIGYRASMVLAHTLAALGLALLAILPELLPSPFVGILLSVCIYAVGGGLLEVFPILLLAGLWLSGRAVKPATKG